MMYEATCSECGQECEIPFRPTGSRPVFCNSCFKKEENGGGRPSFGGGRGGDRGGRSSFGDKPMFPAECDACGNQCQVPFRPTGEKPVYCSDCFSKQAPDSGRNNRSEGRSERRSEGSNNQDGMRKELATIQSKLDAILAVLNPSALVKIEKKEKVAEVKKEVAPAKKEEAVVTKKEVAASKKEIVPKKEATKKEPKKKAAAKKKK